ncbi:MAG TPA: prephenate dehydrogenase [Actinomycetota bacterium]|nr:prephenate dehydrogenase [Actinomycetota bacterium]
MTASRRVAVIGTGLIGGSIGLCLRKSGYARVAGYDSAPEASRKAADAGAIDEAAGSLGEACAGADIVVVATPVGQIAETVRQLSSVVEPGVVVTDVGSAKGPVVQEAESVLGPGRPFVGGHPMAGTEGQGVQAARADLFEGALWILTPTDGTSPQAFGTIAALVTQLGASTLALDPAEHDRLVALVSHLPYLIATTLMEIAGREDDERVFAAAAGSFRDVTRTAGSSPGVWRDILRANRHALLAQLTTFRSGLATFGQALESEDWQGVDRCIQAARDARARLPAKAGRGPEVPVRIEVTVPDRAGILAEITTGVGELGVNIEDLWMDHTAAGGVVHIVVDGPEAASRACVRLSGLGYRCRACDEA